MNRDRRPLFVLLLCGGFTLPVVAAVVPLASWTPWAGFTEYRVADAVRAGP